MNVQRLCPVYKKWLQLNPLNARQHRLAMQAQTQQAHSPPHRIKKKPYKRMCSRLAPWACICPLFSHKNKKSVRPTPYCKNANSNLLQYYRFTPLALLFVDWLHHYSKRLNTFTCLNAQIDWPVKRCIKLFTKGKWSWHQNKFQIKKASFRWT